MYLYQYRPIGPIALAYDKPILTSCRRFESMTLGLFLLVESLLLRNYILAVHNLNGAYK